VVIYPAYQEKVVLVTGCSSFGITLEQRQQGDVLIVDNLLCLSVPPFLLRLAKDGYMAPAKEPLIYWLNCEFAMDMRSRA